MKRPILIASLSACIGASVMAPFAFQRGRGPAVHIVEVQARGHGRPGGILPLSIVGHTRDGCIPIVARSLQRWIVDNDNQVVLEREPLANIPLVAHEPPVPPDMAKGRKIASYKLLDLPLPTGLKPGAWTFNTQASPFSCDGVFGVFSWLQQLAPTGAYDVPVIIDPVLPAGPSDPPAAAVQKVDAK